LLIRAKDLFVAAKLPQAWEGRGRAASVHLRARIRERHGEHVKMIRLDKAPATDEGRSCSPDRTERVVAVAVAPGSWSRSAAHLTSDHVRHLNDVPEYGLVRLDPDELSTDIDAVIFKDARL
jgi:hypothetical protein